MIFNHHKYRKINKLMLLLISLFIITVALIPAARAVEIAVDADPSDEIQNKIRNKMNLFTGEEESGEEESGEEEPAGELSYEDVPAEHRLYEAIKFCVENGYMSGYSDTEFGPDDDITRGQFATVWARTHNVRMHNFEDATKTTGEFDNAIIIMYGLGYFNGVSDNEFASLLHATREQALTIAARTYLDENGGGSEYESYPDSESVSDWARDGVSAAIAAGITDGVFEGENLDPQKPATRSEVCKIIHNLMTIAQ